MKHYIKYVIAGCVLLTFLYAAYLGFVDIVVTPYKLRKEARYAVTSSIETSSAGRIISYSYTFIAQNKTYSGSSSLTRKGYHYFIKFYPPNPRYNKATEIIATQQDIDNMPADGYIKLPHKQLAGAPTGSSLPVRLVILIVCGSIIGYGIYREYKKTIATK